MSERWEADWAPPSMRRWSGGSLDQSGLLLLPLTLEATSATSTAWTPSVKRMYGSLPPLPRLLSASGTSHAFLPLKMSKHGAGRQHRVKRVLQRHALGDPILRQLEQPRPILHHAAQLWRTNVAVADAHRVVPQRRNGPHYLGHAHRG